jgi:hypothetical protein
VVSRASTWGVVLLKMVSGPSCCWQNCSLYVVRTSQYLTACNHNCLTALADPGGNQHSCNHQTPVRVASKRRHQSYPSSSFQADWGLLPCCLPGLCSMV